MFSYLPRPLLAVGAFTVIAYATAIPVHAQSGTWTNLTAGNAGGTWQTAANWQSSTIASGSGNTATFNLDITNDSTVSLNAAVTIGNLIFGDTATNTAAGWILGNGGNTNNTLTLAGSSTPTVTVNNLGTGKSVTLNTRVLGTNGFVKAGLGRLVLSNSANSYTGAISNSFMTVTNFGTPAPLYSTVVQQGRLVLGSGTAAGTGNILVITNPALSAPLTAYLDLNGNTVANNIGLAGDTYLYNGNTNSSATVNGDLWVRNFGRVGSAGEDAAGTVIVNGKVVFNASGNSLFTGLGGALTVLNGTVNHANSNGIIIVQTGTLRAQDGVNIATNSTLRIGNSTGNAGGIFESSANVTRSIGDGAGLISVGYSNTTSTNIGFSAFGGPITVAFGGTSSPTALTWGVTNFLQGSSTLVLNAATADSTLTFANAVDLNGATRTIAVNARTADMTGALTNTTGTAGLTKSGVGTLVLSASNSYNGATTVSAGVLRLGNNSALGTTNAGTTVASAATLDLNARNIGGEVVTIGGTGVGGNGAVVNNGASQANGLRLVLTNAASVGGTARFDTLSDVSSTTIDGGTHALTKVGTNQFTINRGTVNIGQINVDAGNLTLVNNAGGLGDTNFGTSVASGATLTFFNNNLAIGSTNSENITLAGGAILASTQSTNANTLNGTITLSSGTVTNRVDATGVGMVLGGKVTGGGGLEKIQTGTLTLAGSTANDYSGTTTISAGTINLNKTAGTTAIAGNITISGTATLLVSASDQVADTSAVTLSGGTIQRGSGVSEVFGNLNLTTGSFLNFGTGSTGTMSFGTYTASALLTVNNFFQGNVLTFKTNLGGSINNTNSFQFDNAFNSSWDSTSNTFTITAIPEPSTVLAAAGLAGLMLWGPLRRRLGRQPRGR